MKPKMIVDIPPCPVCGSVPDEYYICYSGGDGIGYVVECLDFEKTSKCKTLEQAQKSWTHLVSSAKFSKFRKKDGGSKWPRSART